MVRVFIGVGSNLGNRQENIDNALSLLAPRCKIIKKSSIYETEPVGYEKQGKFLNLVVIVGTELKALEMLDFLLDIEKKLGRVRGIKNGPRTIDLDILFYGDDIIESKDLIVPHPRLHERLFVLEPLNEIDNEKMHPVLKKSVKELLSLIKDK